MYPIEVYVLCESRSAKVAENFLETFLPNRAPVADDYPYPEYADEPTEVFTNAIDLMRRLENDESGSYAMYWNAVDSDGPRLAMLFYTKDGSMIVGLSDPPSSLEKTLSEIATAVAGQYGYITGDNPPPATRNEFIEICRKSTLVNLFEGKLRNIPS